MALFNIKIYDKGTSLTAKTTLLNEGQLDFSDLINNWGFPSCNQLLKWNNHYPWRQKLH